MFSMFDLGNLDQVPLQGIIALINDSDKKVYLTQGSNIPVLLGKIISEIKQGIHTHQELCDDYKKLKAMVIETQIDITHRYLHMSYWYDYFEASGYKLYTKKNHLSYKVSKGLVNVSKNSSKLVVEVYLVNSRCEKTVVGVFETIQQADEFIETYYTQDNKYKLPILANNKLTMARYLSKNESKERSD